MPFRGERVATSPQVPNACLTRSPCLLVQLTVVRRAQGAQDSRERTTQRKACVDGPLAEATKSCWPLSCLNEGSWSEQPSNAS